MTYSCYSKLQFNAGILVNGSIVHKTIKSMLRVKTFQWQVSLEGDPVILFEIILIEYSISIRICIFTVTARAVEYTIVVVHASVYDKIICFS